MLVGSDGPIGAAAPQLAHQRKLGRRDQVGCLCLRSHGIQRVVAPWSCIGVMTEDLQNTATERRTPRMVVTVVVKPDGRTLRFYSWQESGAVDKRRDEDREPGGRPSSGRE
jgi:hypothetical protein